MADQESYPPELDKALSRCRDIADAILKKEREMLDLKIALADAWKQVPPMKVRVFHPCMKCHRPTSDKFGERFICHSHVGVGDAKGDPAIIKILDEFLHGKKD